MHYLPTVNLYCVPTVKAIYSGQLKLQVGQWVVCGDNEKHRFVGATRHSLIVAHPKTPNGKIDRANFAALRAYYKNLKQSIK